MLFYCRFVYVSSEIEYEWPWDADHLFHTHYSSAERKFPFRRAETSKNRKTSKFPLTCDQLEHYSLK